MQAHLQNGKPHHRNAKDHDIGNEVCYSTSKPARTLVLAVTKIWRPRRWQRRTFCKVVDDGADQEPRNCDNSDYLDPSRIFLSCVGYKYTAVQDDQGKLEEAERGGPCELFNKERLRRTLKYVSKCPEYRGAGVP